MIQAERLSKYYGPITAIEDVTFRVEQGEIIGFLGLNAAGKTTTMRILTGSLPSSRGTARIAGFDVAENALEVKRRVGYLPENVPLYPEMSVTAFLKYVAEVKGVSRALRTKEVGRVMECCGVREVANRLCANISKGFRQRVGLAQALIANPPVLILDEPTVGLDPKQIIDIRQMIKDLARDHTVLLSTHILTEVATICERVLIIHQGRIVAQDTMRNLAGSGDRVSFELEAQGPPDGITRTLTLVPAVLNVSPEGPGRYLVEAKSDVSPDISRALVEAGYGLRGIRARTRSLEEVFVEAISEAHHRGVSTVNPI